jgi:hypothetical protein
MARRIKPFPVALPEEDAYDEAYGTIPHTITDRWRLLIHNARAASDYGNDRYAVLRLCRKLYYDGDSAFLRMWQAFTDDPAATADTLTDRPQAFGRIAFKHGPDSNLLPHQIGPFYARQFIPVLKAAGDTENAKTDAENEMVRLLAAHPALAARVPQHHNWSDALAQAMWNALEGHPNRQAKMSGHWPPILPD